MLATFVFGLFSIFLMATDNNRGQNFMSYESRGNPFDTGSSHGQYVHTASFTHSGPITVTQVNGVSHYVINGISLDLSRAKIVGENGELRVLQPIEVPAARVTVYKLRNAVSIDYSGHHFESTQNGLVSRIWER